MLQLVPLFVYLYILQTEICAEVDDLYFGKNLFIYKRRTQPLGSCRKDHIHLIRQFFHIIVHADCVYDFKHISVDFGIFLINITAGTVPYDLHILMAHQKSHQLGAGIACGTDNSCFYHNYSPQSSFFIKEHRYHIPVFSRSKA